MAERLKRTVAQLLGCNVASMRALTGGDINQAYQMELVDGRRLFVKSNHKAPSGMFQEEARGLNWLSEASPLVVPKVLACGDDSCPVLVLEYLPPASATEADWELLGRGLAQLHAASAPTFGALPDNYIGTLTQSNTGCAEWVEFYWSRRLLPQVTLATDTRRAPNAWATRFQRLAARLSEWLVNPAAPERLHGDLWSGNVLYAQGRGPCLIDPAAYAGHGEVDLAMMRLFGGFSERVYDAYVEVRPLAPDFDERVALYQLYPLLVHVNLFGGSYVARVEQILSRYVSR